MRDRYSLLGLANDDLLTAISTLVRRGNELTADLLAHLAELDGRRLYLELGFSSLFTYCREGLGLCEASAWRRVTAARVGRQFPRAFEYIAAGALHLSALCSLAPHLNLENAAELFEACSNKSRRQVDELLAARFPKADVPERVRVDPLSIDRYSLQFTIDGEALAELERVRALARHRLPDGELSQLFKLAMRTLRRALEKQRFGVGRKPRARKLRREAFATGRDRATPPSKAGEAPSAKAQPSEASEVFPRGDGAAALPPGGSRDRARVPVADAREVYLRDDRQCAYVSPRGRRCGAQAFLELDHTQPRAVGGTTTSTNLRLRCRAHNQMHARRYFGEDYVKQAITNARRAGSLGSSENESAVGGAEGPP